MNRTLYRYSSRVTRRGQGVLKLGRFVAPAGNHTLNPSWSLLMNQSKRCFTLEETDRLRKIEEMTENIQKEMGAITETVKKIEKKQKRSRWKYLGFLIYLSPIILIYSYIASRLYRNRQELGKDRDAYKVINIRTSQIVSTAVPPISGAMGSGKHLVSFTNLIKTIRNATNDKTVSGITLDLDGAEAGIGLAKTEELLEELRRFKNESGKFIMGYGKLITMKDFILGTVADELYLQPSGIVATVGFSFSKLFFKGLLEKLGVKPVVIRREKYKCFMETFTDDEYSETNKEQMSELGQSLYDQMLRIITDSGVIEKPPAEDGSFQSSTIDDVKSFIDESPLSAEDAASKGVIRGTLQRKDFERRISAYCHGDFDEYLHGDFDGPRGVKVPRSEDVLLLSPREYGEIVKTGVKQSETAQAFFEIVQEKDKRYLQRDDDREIIPDDDRDDKKSPLSILNSLGLQTNDEGSDEPEDVIALINVTGQITSGESDGDNVGSDTVEALLQKVGQYNKNYNPVGLVLRIDSPGGDALASESIWNAVMQLRQKTKIPVVVSMGDLCASGGYYIASAADHIVALPATITGSIGVIMASADLSEAMENVGVKHDTIKFGENSELLMPFEPPTERKLNKLNELIDAMYANFLLRVSEGRGMPKDKVRELAQGRVWSGTQGLDIGLVDDLGGLFEAKRICQELAGIHPDQQINFKHYQTKMEKIMDFLDMYSSFSFTSTLRSMVIAYYKFLSAQRTYEDAQQTRAYFLMDPAMF